MEDMQFLGASVRSMMRIGGNNSQVFRVELENGTTYAAKRYFHGGNGRSRLAVEFGALQLLWERGIRSIPRPVMAANREEIGVYGFLEGRRPHAGEIASEDVDRLTGFLRAIRDLQPDAGSDVGPASEACFSLAEAQTAVERRIHALETTENKDAARLASAARSAMEFIAGRWAHMRVDVGAVLPADRRILSPSDFGFHNTLRRPDGTLAFLDFEYFGWDDPAKLACDTLLHPQLDLTVPLRRRLFANLNQVYGGDADFPRRFRLLYPVLSLNWCLIVLNAFTREGASRHRFANSNQSVRQERLKDAQSRLDKLRAEAGSNPYAEE